MKDNMSYWWRYNKLRHHLNNLKWFFRNAWRYRKGFYYEVRPWDSHGAMWLFKESIRDVRDSIQSGIYGQEVPETRIPKEMDINRAIRLIENQQDGDYAARCGYDFSYGAKFIPIDGKPGYYEMKTDEPKEVEKHNEKAMKKALALEEAEHKELIKIIANYREWWV
jgi:hypothetical protein